MSFSSAELPLNDPMEVSPDPNPWLKPNPEKPNLSLQGCQESREKSGKEGKGGQKKYGKRREENRERGGGETTEEGKIKT